MLAPPAPLPEGRLPSPHKPSGPQDFAQGFGLTSRASGLAHFVPPASRLLCVTSSGSPRRPPARCTRTLAMLPKPGHPQRLTPLGQWRHPRLPVSIGCWKPSTFDSAALSRPSLPPSYRRVHDMLSLLPTPPLKFLSPAIIASPRSRGPACNGMSCMVSTTPGGEGLSSEVSLFR